MTRSSVPIAAIATAQGRGGIGVVRLSGFGIDEIILSILGILPKPRTAYYGPFLDNNKEPIDYGIAIRFISPKSFTGEDILELQGHGGPVVMQLLLRRVLEAGKKLGVRVANPGEFTERAYRNGKMDLLQAESVADIIGASTEQAARSALRASMFSDAIQSIVDKIIDLKIFVEATLDFPEEDVSSDLENLRAKLHFILIELDKLKLKSRTGILLREGLHILIVGAPNVGKSSLMNALVGESVAIVSPFAGTTRDKIVRSIQVQGVPLTLTDTAGLRETADEVEAIGIECTRKELKKADFILVVCEFQDIFGFCRKNEKISEEKFNDIKRFFSEKFKYPFNSNVFFVFNKIDQCSSVSLASIPEAHPRIFFISAKCGDGLSVLLNKILELAGFQAVGECQFLARERHLSLLGAASDYLLEADSAALSNQWDLFAEGLRLSHDTLGEIIGKMAPDELLGKIFSRFCIGK